MAKHKILYITRHAKSSWDRPDRADIDRPLSDRGVRNAYTMATRMRQRGHNADHIITSPANRALHTAIIFARVLNFPAYQVEINEDLYMCGADRVLQTLLTADNSNDSVMLFGHNPDFTFAANNFLGEQISNIPTCGLVRMEFNVSRWEDVHRGKLVDYIYDFPKRK